MGHNGCDSSQTSGPWAIGSGYRFTPLLRANPRGGSMTPKQGSGYPGPSPELWGLSHPHFRPICGLGCPVHPHSKTGTVL